MDKIEKFLARRTKKERILLMSAIELLIQGEPKGCDIKKLSGKKNHYRLRIGQFRIIFKKVDQKITIKNIQKRDSKTYSKLN